MHAGLLEPVNEMVEVTVCHFVRVHDSGLRINEANAAIGAEKAKVKAADERELMHQEEMLAKHIRSGRRNPFPQVHVAQHTFSSDRKRSRGETHAGMASLADVLRRIE